MRKINHGDVLSLQQILNRANSEGIYISRYLTVQAIKSGALQAQKVGKTYLIQWDLFLEWVMGNSGALRGPRPEELYSNIGPIEFCKKKHTTSQGVVEVEPKMATVAKPVRVLVKRKAPSMEEKPTPMKRGLRRKQT